MERATCVPGDPVSHHHRLRAECTYRRTTRSCARSVIRATRSQCGVTQLVLRAYPDDRLEDRGGARPRFVERVHLRGPIITIPITLYGYGNGDDAEEGVPSDGAMGREHERDKVGRCSRLVRPLGDRRRDMLQLNPAAESRSPRALCPRQACAGRSPRAALAMNAAPGSLLRQHFLHYFSEEVPTGERGIRTAEPRTRVNRPQRSQRQA